METEGQAYQRSQRGQARRSAGGSRRRAGRLVKLASVGMVIAAGTAGAAEQAGPPANSDEIVVAGVSVTAPLGAMSPELLVPGASDLIGSATPGATPNSATTSTTSSTSRSVTTVSTAAPQSAPTAASSGAATSTDSTTTVPTTAGAPATVPTTEVPTTEVPTTEVPPTTVQPTAVPTTTAPTTTVPPTTAAPTTAAVADHVARGEAALAQISYPWRSRLSGWSIVFSPGRDGAYGYTYTDRRVIEIFVRDGQSQQLLAHVIAHELGHAVDVSLNNGDERNEWLAVRGIQGATWWPGNGATDFSTGAGDFAESFAAWQVGATHFRSNLAGVPNGDQLAVLSRLAG